MTLTIKLPLFTCVLVCLTTSTQAQDAVTAPINNWSYQRHSSTAAEGYLRGTATVIAAQGQKNYLDSVALVNFRIAQRKAIENSKLYVKTYWENKNTIREHRERYARVPATAEQRARALAMGLPDRLTPERYNVHSGTLVWPHILRMEQYTALRVRIDQLLPKRSPEDSGDGSPSQRNLETLIDGMQRLLTDNHNTVTADQYGASKQFLRSLSYEMKFPMDARVANPQAPSTDGAIQ